MTLAETLRAASDHLALDQDAEALAAAEAAVAQDPACARAYGLRAWGRLRAGDADGAADDVERCLRLDPADAEGACVRAALCYDANDFPGGIVWATVAINAGFARGTAHGIRAECQVRTGQFAAALPDTEVMLRRVKRPYHRVLTHALRAIIFMQADDAAAALAACDAGLAIQGEGAESIRATLFEKRSNLRLSYGDRPGSLADAQAAVALSPDDPNAQLALGVACIENGEFDRALEAAEGLLALQPGSPQALSVRGAAYRQLGRFPEAISDLEETLLHYPSHGPTQEQLALARRHFSGTPMEAAYAAAETVVLRQGATREASIEAGVESARREFGPNSFEYMEALNLLACTYEHTHRYAEAAEAWGRCCAVKGNGDEEHTKQRLTYTVNLADVLEKSGQIGEAERVLREASADRRAFYGESHAGYAFGLLPLASLLGRRGRIADALDVVDGATDVLWLERHHRHAEALALRGRIAAWPGHPGDCWAHLSDQPEDIVGATLAAMPAVVPFADPAPHDRRVTRDLLATLEARYGAEHFFAASAASMIAEVEKGLGDHAARADALGRVRAYHDRTNAPVPASQVTLQLAEAWEEAGRADDAHSTYREAVARADATGHPALRAFTRDRLGAYLGRTGRTAEAVPVLRQAVALARPSGDGPVLGQTLVSLGVCVQHGGGLDEARELLTEGLALLPAGHSYYLVATSHLRAIEVNGSCGCGDGGANAAEQFRTLLLAQFPSDFRPDVQVTYENGDFQVRVRVSEAEPTPEQNALVARAVAHARAAFARRAGLG